MHCRRCAFSHKIILEASFAPEATVGYTWPLRRFLSSNSRASMRPEIDVPNPKLEIVPGMYAETLYRLRAMYQLDLN